jgi:hypothetical protein
MTRSKTRDGEWVSQWWDSEDVTLITRDPEPPQFNRVPFPVKALKFLLHELQNEWSLAAPAPLDAESGNGDSDWSDEEKARDERFAFLLSRCDGRPVLVVRAGPLPHYHPTPSHTTPPPARLCVPLRVRGILTTAGRNGSGARWQADHGARDGKRTMGDAMASADPRGVMASADHGGHDGKWTTGGRNEVDHKGRDGKRTTGGAMVSGPRGVTASGPQGVRWQALTTGAMESADHGA